MVDSLRSCLLFVLVSSWDLVFADHKVTIENVEYDGHGRFPEVIEVLLSYGDKDSYLRLDRDDETTGLLTESVFDASSFLPSGVFTQRRSKEFAAYDSGSSNVLIVHRETENAEPKFYGRFQEESRNMVIRSIDGSHLNHSVRQEEIYEKRRRIRRDTSTPDDVIELFLFTDLSVHQHFENEMMATSKVYDYIKKWLPCLVKEVDAIFEKLGEYGTSKPIRVYFQQYQIITDTRQQQWVEDNFSDNELQASAVTDFQSHYNKFYTKFAFPYADHVMALTKLEMADGEQVMTAGNVCGETANIAASIVRIDHFQEAMSQAIARTFGVSLDGVSNTCVENDGYIMSNKFDVVTDPAIQGNRWRFSTCSIESFQAAIDGGFDLSCLQTEDKYFDWEKFNNAPFMSEAISVDQQCEIRYQSGATFCDNSNQNVVDCYSATQGCLVNGVCVPFTVSHLTSCSNKNGFTCQFGFCHASTEVTESSTDSVTPTATQPFKCVLKTKVKDYDVPGCKCGGCDKEDKDCEQGDHCFGKKVRVTTTYVHESCASLYQPGPRRIITMPDDRDKQQLTAEVSQNDSGRWKVELVAKQKK